MSALPLTLSQSFADMYPLKLPCLSLTKLAMIKIATCLWTQPDIRDQLKVTVRVEDFHFPKLCERQKMIFHSVFENINQLKCLPVEQRDKLKFVAMQLGISAFEWIANIYDKDLNKENLIDHLQWDSVGCIDGAEIFKSAYYSGKIKADNSTSADYVHLRYLEKCVYYYGFTCYLRHSSTCSDGATACDYYFYESKNEDPASTFKIIQIPPYQKFKYLWLRANEQKTLAATTTRNLLYYCMNFEGLAATIDGVNFLIKCASEGGQVNFCAKNSEVLAKIAIDVLLHWPWMHLYFPLIQKSPNLINPTIYYHAFKRINVQYYLQYQILDNTQEYHDLIREFWQNAPLSVKLAAGENPVFAECIANILRVNGIELLKEILEDEDISTVREDLLDSGHGHWTGVLYDVLLKDFKTLDYFTESVLHSDEERRCFRNFQFKKIVTTLVYRKEDSWKKFVLWYCNAE